MSSMEWGIGVPGALGPAAIGNLAALAEHCGYQGFWFNCVAPDADPPALLDAALVSTERIEIGVGVIPLDGYPSSMLASRLHGGRADDSRVVLGVGSGGTRRDSLTRVRDGIAQLRSALPRARIAVGAKRPLMVALAAQSADAILFSMMRPDEAQAIAPSVVGYNYHRVALDPGARGRVHGEMVSHGVWPKDGSMPGERQLLGTVLPSRDNARGRVVADLEAYPAGWIPVLRPLPSQTSDLGEWRDLFQLLCPR